jgi:hypothetical protein
VNTSWEQECDASLLEQFCDKSAGNSTLLTTNKQQTWKQAVRTQLEANLLGQTYDKFVFQHVTTCYAF